MRRKRVDTNEKMNFRGCLLWRWIVIYYWDWNTKL
jgi:hypothetical protein